jgi:hypothetical protein
MDAIAGDPVTWRNGGDVRHQGPMSIQSMLNHDIIAINPSAKKMRARRGTIIHIAECVLKNRSRGNDSSRKPNCAQDVPLQSRY